MAQYKPWLALLFPVVSLRISSGFVLKILEKVITFESDFTTFLPVMD